MSDNDTSGNHVKRNECSWIHPSTWGQPPPWVDWIHKLGPLIGIIAGLGLFWLAWYFTLDPVYTRAVLQNTNDGLKLALGVKETDLASLEQRIQDVKTLLKRKEAEIPNLQETIVKLQETIVKKGKEVELLVANSEEQRTTLEALRGSAAELQSALTKSKGDLSDAEKRLFQARAAAETAYDVIKVKGMTAFKERVLDLCLTPALKLSVPWFARDEFGPPLPFTRYAGCFTSVLRSEPILEGLPEMERKQFTKIAERLDKERVAKLAPLDQERDRTEAEASRLFAKSRGIDINIGGARSTISDQPDPMREERVESLRLKDEATKLLENGPRLFEQFKVIIIQDLATLREEYFAKRRNP